MTRAQIEAARARFQLTEGAEQLRSSPSRFGKAGLLARNALLRLTKPLAVREALLDDRLLIGLEAVAMDGAVSQRAASSFPEMLDLDQVTDVATRIGQLYLHADDQVMTSFIRHHRVWEESEMRFLQKAVRTGVTFVDVGANVGYFSVLGSALTGSEGRVIAIEPEPRNLSLLKANLWRHGCSNAVVVPMAAYRERGFLPLRVNEENRGAHQVGCEEGASSLVPCARLDDLLAGLTIDVIKVDTQGVDHDVIAGLSGVIETGRPLTIMCEFWLEGMTDQGVDPQEVADGYERAGFDLSLLDDQGEPRSASPADIVAAAAEAPTGFVNVVLRTGR